MKYYHIDEKVLEMLLQEDDLAKVKVVFNALKLQIAMVTKAVIAEALAQQGISEEQIEKFNNGEEVDIDDTILFKIGIDEELVERINDARNALVKSVYEQYRDNLSDEELSKLRSYVEIKDKEMEFNNESLLKMLDKQYEEEVKAALAEVQKEIEANGLNMEENDSGSEVAEQPQAESAEGSAADPQPAMVAEVNQAEKQEKDQEKILPDEFQVENQPAAEQQPAQPMNADDNLANAAAEAVEASDTMTAGVQGAAENQPQDQQPEQQTQDISSWFEDAAEEDNLSGENNMSNQTQPKTLEDLAQGDAAQTMQPSADTGVSNSPSPTDMGDESSSDTSVAPAMDPRPDAETGHSEEEDNPYDSLETPAVAEEQKQPEELKVPGEGKEKIDTTQLQHQPLTGDPSSPVQPPKTPEQIQAEQQAAQQASAQQLAESSPVEPEAETTAEKQHKNLAGVMAGMGEQPVPVNLGGEKSKQPQS